MTDAMARTQPRADTKALRGFGYTFGVVATLAGAFLLWRGRVSPGRGFLAGAAAFFLVGAVAPGLLRPFHGPWMRFAEVLGHINTKILLGLFFFVGVTPTGFLMRLFGKDPMSRTFKRAGDGSYWIKPTEHPDGVRHFDRQF